MHVFNNTIVNTASACMTLEMNVVAAHVHENACAQSSTYFPAGWVYPNCITTTNNAAGIYVRIPSLQYSKPMDWHNNVWQNQGGPVSSWTIYNVQNMSGYKGTCGNLTTFLNKNNSSAQMEPSSFCTANPGFDNASVNDFRLLASSPLRAAGVGGSDVGALPFGSSMFPVGPR